MNATDLVKRPHEQESLMQQKRQSTAAAKDVQELVKDEKPIPKKPGRKPLTTEASSKRIAQNRAAQRAFRERRQKYVADLESKVKELSEHQERSERENKQLRILIQKLQAENTKLRGSNFTFEQPNSAAPSDDFSSILNSLANPTTATSVNTLDLSTIFNMHQAAVGASSSSSALSDNSTLGHSSADTSGSSSSHDSPQSITTLFEVLNQENHGDISTNSSTPEDIAISLPKPDNTPSGQDQGQRKQQPQGAHVKMQTPNTNLSSSKTMADSILTSTLSSSINGDMFAPLSSFPWSPSSATNDSPNANRLSGKYDLTSGFFTEYRESKDESADGIAKPNLTEDLLSMLFPNASDYDPLIKSDPVFQTTTTTTAAAASAVPTAGVPAASGDASTSTEPPFQILDLGVECICNGPDVACVEVCPKHGSFPNVAPALKTSGSKEILTHMCSPSNRLNDAELDDLCSLMYKQAKCSEVQKRIKLERERLKLETELKLYQTKQRLAKEFGLPPV